VPARVDKAMADGSAIKGSEDAMQRCNELEAELAELRAAYDQYFMGNERLPPLKKHDGFKKQFMKLKSSSVRQTAAKFRIESIGQKMLTFERLWERTIQQIEAGTYKRDLMRLKRHQKVEKKSSADADFDVDEDLDLSDLDEGGDDLASALAAAEAAASARAKAPPAPSLAPAIKPVTGLAPAILPVTPPGGVKPLVTPPAGLKPLTPPIPALSPPIPPRPSGPPKISAPIATGVTAAFKPAGSTGSNPAIPAVRPPPTTGSSPAFRPPTGSTGSNPALRAAAPPRPPAAGGGDGGLSDTKVKAIYDAYVMAKKRCGEDTRAVTLDSVASSLRKQVPELMKQHNAKTVEFKVVIKDGKAVLRALPKE
jgi:hypothetical protein